MALGEIMRLAPQQYYFKEGALEDLPLLLKNNKIRRVLLVHGTRSLQAAPELVSSLQEIEVRQVLFGGECSRREIERIKQAAAEFNADTILGLGGGKLMDTVKVAADELNVKEVLIPSVPATCAAFATLSVLYDEHHRWTGNKNLNGSAHLVIVDPRMLIKAPYEYLISGIGDTLAKWYETRVQLDNDPHRHVNHYMGYVAALLCRDVLLEIGAQAIEDAKNEVLSESYLKTIEIIFLAAGVVGGFTEYGKSVAAHTFYYHATHFQEPFAYLHGNVVAYATLVQIAMEGRTEELHELYAINERLHLPTGLKQIGLDPEDLEALNALAERMTQPGGKIHALPGEITKERILQAIRTVELLHSKNEFRQVNLHMNG